jgi:hypothetical protein
MAHCGHCGAELAPGDEFCEACGAAVAPGHPDGQAPSEGSSGSTVRTALVAVVIVLGLLAVGGIVWGLMTLPMFSTIELVSSATTGLDATGTADSTAAATEGPIVVAPPVPTVVPSVVATPPTTPATGATATASAAEVKQITKIAGINSTSKPKKIELDYVQLLTGPAAETAAAAHGDEVTNDYYVVNDSKKIKTFPVSKSVVVVLHPGEGAEYKHTFSLAEFKTLYETSNEKVVAGRHYLVADSLFYVTIKNGVITHIENLWTP